MYKRKNIKIKISDECSQVVKLLVIHEVQVGQMYVRSNPKEENIFWPLIMSEL